LKRATQEGRRAATLAAIPAATLAMVLALAAGPVHAVDSTPPFESPQLQQRYLALTHEFRCVQCQNEALADSNVSLAGDLRLEIHDLIKAGKSDDEIRDFLVARYGEFILFRPRMSLKNAWLWAAPIMLLLGGGWLAFRILRQRARLPITDDDGGGGATP
jgi:cytochrome c-type biogenesis protein CcmH